MDQSIITRRRALTAAGAFGAAAALTGVRTVQAASDDEGNAVVGTWVVTVTSATRPTSTSIVGFAPGGSLVTTDNVSPGDVALGAWEPQGSHGFDAVFYSFAFDSSSGSPVFIGTAIIRPKGTVDDDRIHGTYSVDFKPPSGPTQPNVDHGTFAGSRLEP